MNEAPSTFVVILLSCLIGCMAAFVFVMAHVSARLEQVIRYLHDSDTCPLPDAKE